MSEVNVMPRAKLLDRQPVIRVDVFLHGLPDDTLEHLRQAIEKGLTPSGMDFTGDDGSIAILKFTRPENQGQRRSGQPHSPLPS